MKAWNDVGKHHFLAFVPRARLYVLTLLNFWGLKEIAVGEAGEVVCLAALN